MLDLNLPTHFESKEQKFLYGLFEFDENWHKERNLYPVMIGNHFTREECVAIVQYDCCISHSKLKDDDSLDYEIDTCLLLQHLESCTYAFDDLDGCSERLNIMFNLDAKKLL